MSALRFERVWFRYGEAPVLRDVSFDVRAGESVALLGRNGAGKTTLTKLVVALLHPERGYVRVGDRTTEGRVPEHMAHLVAYVFQHPDQQLFARTVRAEVAYGPRQLHRDAPEIDRVVDQALEWVGLEAMRDEHPYDLPAPQRKLVTIAAAIAQRPRVMVLDEPTQGLDRAGARRVAGVVRRLKDERVAVLAVTHDVTFMAEALERAVVLAEGRIVFDGLSTELVGDEERTSSLGLDVPSAAQLSAALGLPDRPLRIAAVAAALAERLDAADA